MATELENELAQFHRFVGEQLAIGTHSSPEELLDDWRAAHPASRDDDESVAALNEALTEMRNGDAGQPKEQFDREFRVRHGLPPKS